MTALAKQPSACTPLLLIHLLRQPLNLNFEWQLFTSCYFRFGSSTVSQPRNLTGRNQPIAGLSRARFFIIGKERAVWCNEPSFVGRRGRGRRAKKSSALSKHFHKPKNWLLSWTALGAEHLGIRRLEGPENDTEADHG
ncbi:MAG TPA: hypothetical protein VN283_10805 [Thiobacillus sp.]|nr:hypothetical protein [Thiobacillus sp.]